MNDEVSRGTAYDTKQNIKLVNAKVLLVEDDQSLSDWIKDYLVSKNFYVEQCFRGDEAVARTLTFQPDLLILDGMLPSVDGLEVCKAVRGHFQGRIIMLTARDSDNDEVMGLEAGADDYLSKPIRAQVLLARMNTQLRHLFTEQILQHTAKSQTSIRLGNLYINLSARSALLKGENVDLSTGEFDMLCLLARQAGQTVTRDDLTKTLRGFDYNGYDRSVDLKVSRLRKKLGDDGKLPSKIVTVWGKGYMLVKGAWH